MKTCSSYSGSKTTYFAALIQTLKVRKISGKVPKKLRPKSGMKIIKVKF